MICLNRLAEIVSADIDKLLNSLPITLRRSYRSYSGKCWVHSGDNCHAMSLYEKDGVYKWVCHTRNCQQTFNSSIIGFTRGILSNVKEGWEKPGDRLYSFSLTLEYLKELYGLTDSNLQIDHEAIEKKNSDKLRLV